jgi:hypothetical protein
MIARTRFIVPTHASTTRFRSTTAYQRLRIDRSRHSVSLESDHRAMSDSICRACSERKKGRAMVPRIISGDCFASSFNVRTGLAKQVHLDLVTDLF